MMDQSLKIPQLCRLCLIHENVEVNIFSEEENTFSGTFLKITTCLPITVAFNDEFPKKICISCSSKLASFYDFVNTSLSAEKQLFSWLKPTAPACEIENGCNVQLEGQVLSSVKEELNESSGEDYTNSAQFNVNFLAEDIQPQTVLATMQSIQKRPRRKAAFINRSYNENDDNTLSLQTNESSTTNCIQKHKAEGQALNNSPQKIKNSSNHLNVQLETAKKSRKQRSRKKLRRIVSVKGRKSTENTSKEKTSKTDDDSNNPLETVSCEVCNLKCRNAVTLALHSKQHNDNMKYTCPVCQFQTASKYVIESHTKVHEGTAKYKCEVCHKGFSDSTRASEHKYLHSGEKPFQCEICGKSFTFSWSLWAHRHGHHWETITGTPLVKWDCTVCQKHYTSASGLRRHKLSKHATMTDNNGGGSVVVPDRSVLCDTCGKRLSSKDKLRVHLRIHTGYKPFVCEICSKCFARSEQLRDHERTHTGEKPYVCLECGRGFTQRTPLRIHQRSHTGERPYVCKLCGKGFVSKAAMDTHSRSCTLLLLSHVTPSV